MRLFKTGIFLPPLTAMLLLLGPAFAAAQHHTGFGTVDEAAVALVEALEKNDVPTLLALLGPDSKDVFSSGDEVADANARAQFLALYESKHALVADGEEAMVLEVGDEDWPLPIPFVMLDGKWYLDGAAGAVEINIRRIGHNELGAIAVCRGFVDAQIKYAVEARDGNDAGIFAAKLMSDQGRQNGLYWPVSEGELESPLGEGIARASALGYRAIAGDRQSYHGYYYRMLYAQGSDADGGAIDYFEDGRLTRGIALIAWPADYGVSGVMSFMVNHRGTVYQKDLGEDTNALVENVDVYNPDSSWSVVESGDDI